MYKSRKKFKQKFKQKSKQKSKQKFKQLLKRESVRRFKSVAETLLFAKAAASFTIEAAVIIPIIMLVTVLFINTSLDILNTVRMYTDEMRGLIEAAYDADRNESDYKDKVNTEYLYGRPVLLKYKLLEDGLDLIKGANDEE